jgi:hypothetical protein
MSLLRISPSGQVYDARLPNLKITPDQAGGYYLHGKGHFIFCQTFEEAEMKRAEMELQVYGRKPA